MNPPEPDLSFRNPLTAAAATSAPEEPATASIQHAAVLVVDDSRTMRLALIRALNHLGFRNISEATNGRQALELVLAKPCDLMLLDLEMPEMTGMEVLVALKTNRQLAGLPIIVISGADQVENAVQCIELGAEDYLPKPFNPTLLRARVTSSLEKKRLRDLDRLRLAQLQTEKELLEIEKEKSERLLLNILPKAIADRLKVGERTIANGHPTVTVMFADLVGFTALSRRTAPGDLVGILNGIFTTFDLLVERSCLEKIKTIGDAYMLAGGIPVPRDDHAQAVADVALEMVRAMDRMNAANGTDLKMRIGINTGPIVAGVIGKRKFTYDLWGDTVNVASRMESSGLPGAIQVSESTYLALKDDFVLEERGIVPCKGLGDVKTYLLKERKTIVWNARAGANHPACPP
ncbi:MAG: response regulator [Parvularculaceae bacterium]|nr:response regulator [Parvularculaceae bacterium]